MRYVIWLKLLLSVAFMSLTSWVVASPENYTLDPMHTTVSWQVNHLGFSNFSGKYYAVGKLVFDESAPANSRVSVIVRIESGVTGIVELDKHIAGNAFLDSRKFPVATFVSKKVTMTGVRTANVDGTLKLHGVTMPFSLKVTFNKVGINKISNKKTAGFSGQALINRSDFGVNIFLPDISDEVKLNIQVEATLEKSASK